MQNVTEFRCEFLCRVRLTAWAHFPPQRSRCRNRHRVSMIQLGPNLWLLRVYLGNDLEGKRESKLL